MFKQLHQLAAEGKCKLMLTIAAEGDNLALQITPLPTEKDASAGLSQPLKMVGTPSELDDQFTTILGSYSNSRKALQESLADAQAIMDAAAKDATQKASQALTNNAKKPAAAATTAAATPTAEAPAAAPAASAGEVSLF